MPVLLRVEPWEADSGSPLYRDPVGRSSVLQNPQFTRRRSQHPLLGIPRTYMKHMRYDGPTCITFLSLNMREPFLCSLALRLVYLVNYSCS
jgi:hypothetical protein